MNGLATFSGSVTATSNVSCATLSSAGNVIATGGYVPLSALSNSISLASLPGQLLPSAFSNSSIPVSAISGMVGGTSSSNYVTLSASNIVSAGNVIASNGYVPLSALSNSVSLATLPGQLASSAYSSNSIPVSALSNVSTAVPMQAVLSYLLPGAAMAQTLLNNTNTSILFTTQFNSQGNTGITYNAATGVFTNASGSTLVVSTSFSIVFSPTSASSAGIRQASIVRTSSGVIAGFGDTNVPGGTDGNGVHICASATIVLNPLDTLFLQTLQDSGVTQYIYNAQVHLAVLSSPTAIVNAAVQSPMHLSLYGIPSTYSSGSSVANTTWSTAGYYYFLFPSSSLSSVNWAPAYTNSTRLMIPVTGLYALKLTYLPNGTNTGGEVFLSKNMNNNNDVNCGDDRLLAIQYSNTTGGVNEITISATVYLLSTDFVSFGVYFGTAPSITGFTSRCSATVTLIQNASSIAANVAGNLKLGTVTNPYGYPVDPAGTSGNISAGNLGMFRNRIINGDMRINQRGNTSITVAQNAASGVYMIDRFATYTGGTGSCVASVIALTNADAPFQYGLRSSFKNTITTAYPSTSTNYQLQGQNIEGINIQDFNWGQTFGTPVTVSFWSRTNGITNLAVSIGNLGTTFYYNTNVAITTSGTWQYNIVTIPAPPIASTGTWDVAGSLNGIGLRLLIGSTYLPSSTGWVNANSLGTPASTIWITTVGNYVEFTGLQLEKGSIATPFEFRPLTIELGLCQRYFNAIVGLGDTSTIVTIGVGAANTTTTVEFAVRLSVAMRTIPNLIVYGSWNCGGGGASTITSNTTISSSSCVYICCALGIAVAGQSAHILYKTTSGSYMYMTAEL